MPWWRFWDQNDRQTRSADRTRLAGGHPDSAPQAAVDPRRTELERRRRAILYDIAQGELAASPDNPWNERRLLLTESLENVAADLTALAKVNRRAPFALPDTPIINIKISEREPITISMMIGREKFGFAEAVDWDERGGAEVKGELHQTDGDPERLVPANTPIDRVEALRTHLSDSIFTLATDLRDRALNGEPLPQQITLADLARPCPTCGGWQDWRGRCPACSIREMKRQELRAEERRLLDERDREEEERHRYVERLPIARRRLADVEQELSALP